MHDLTALNWSILLMAVFTVAFFYSSVGHGGATGYLAALALLGIAPSSARVAVLIANVLVAGVAWWQFWRAGHFEGKILLLFAIASVPCAWLGSKVQISPRDYKIVLGGVLAAAGLLLMFRARQQTDDVPVQKCFWPLGLTVGGGLGFLAGLTGWGGGFFLRHLITAFVWDNPNTTGGIAAGFIVLNSIAGLVGTGWQKVSHAGPLLWLTLPAVIGALVGTYFGARRWSTVTFSRVLAGILIFAGTKLLFEAVK
jgi:uncharacterized membrane protein YfcA